jgi:hypothetical protein
MLHPSYGFRTSEQPKVVRPMENVHPDWAVCTDTLDHATCLCCDRKRTVRKSQLRAQHLPPSCLSLSAEPWLSSLLPQYVRPFERFGDSWVDSSPLSSISLQRTARGRVDGTCNQCEEVRRNQFAGATHLKPVIDNRVLSCLDFDVIQERSSQDCCNTQSKWSTSAQMTSGCNWSAHLVNSKWNLLAGRKTQVGRCPVVRCAGFETVNIENKRYFFQLRTLSGRGFLPTWLHS